ncbi:hypothetical protein N9C10_03575 [Flavobacteriaceae bacterium]|nr:hypothetical protein [Flavobacteriaceae bacterium]
MIGELVDVAMENQVVALAKITGKDDENNFKVKYMSATKKRWGDRRLYNYEKEEYEITEDNICGYYNTSNEEIAGYEKVDGAPGFVICEPDSDSEYESESEPESEDFSESDDNESSSGSETGYLNGLSDSDSN